MSYKMVKRHVKMNLNSTPDMFERILKMSWKYFYSNPTLDNHVIQIGKMAWKGPFKLNF